MPMSAPEMVVAINLSRRVGTPEASAASSSSRMVAKPKPSCERAIAREIDDAIKSRAIIISRNKYSMYSIEKPPISMVSARTI